MREGGKEDKEEFDFRKCDSCYKLTMT